MGFASNLAALNAAKKFMKAAGFDAAAYKEFFSIEKHDGEWHAMQIQPFPAPRDPLSCLKDEREGIFAFPKGDALNDAALTSSQPDSELEALQAQADAIANAEQSASQLPNGKVWIHVSSVSKPTKRVWAIADEMVAKAASAGQPAPSRKEVQDECVRRGIASGTARTQYQAWKKSHDSDLKNAALAAELSKRFNQTK